MIIFLLLTVIYAKIKGYRIIPIVKAYSLYPYVAVEIVSLFFQMTIFSNDYRYIQYASIIKTVYLYTLIIPIIVYRLYMPGIYGSILTIIGTILNNFVMSQNGGKMPVFASLSKITGYFNASVFSTIDKIHIVGNEMTKYKFLTDFIDIGYSILSIGDIFIHSFTCIVIYNVIKEVNKSLENKTVSKKGIL